MRSDVNRRQSCRSDRRRTAQLFARYVPDTITSKTMEAVARGLLVAFARFISGASARYINCQPDTNQRIYFANHTSHLDALVIWSLLPAIA